MSRHFSSRIEKFVSGEIAALKIYICICLYSDRKMITIPLTEYNHKLGLRPMREREFIGSHLTYDQLSDYCSLSRVLVSRGIQKLISSGLIKKEGSRKKIIYEINNLKSAGWCKLPCRGLVGTDGVIFSFKGLKNRYQSERDALKIFLYLLSIRSNSESKVTVSRGKISIATGISVYEIDSSIGVLRAVELLEDVKSLGFLMSSSNRQQESDRYASYLVKGAMSLNLGNK
ncbi:helix-turn-helix domain-containing protein [Shewanella subflava]|uniref:MarR family transcriptional regulator n=1 Tax=Shewanella subflava TaxID=2986476 RepID=A0ABT3I5U8_9GAMM|nr:hypothetical protein [Shewanella subflava]MCW3171415.1 hypothetical protein [Shewanella subflava]